MGKPIKITTAGLKELQARMKRLEVALEPKDVRPILVEALDLIRVKALENLRAVIKTKTGSLERSLVPRPSKSDKIASAWLKAGTTSPGSNARHAHLIEYGHDIWRGGSKRKGKGGSLGTVKGRPFFRPAVDAMRSKVRRTIEEGIVKLLWNSVRN